MDARRAPRASRRRAAIESDVRAVGRIVVCVEAAAEVSTAMISELVERAAEDLRASSAEHVVRVVDQLLRAAVCDWAAIATRT